MLLTESRGSGLAAGNKRLTLVPEAGWCPGCNSRQGAAGEGSRLGGLYMPEVVQWPESSHRAGWMFWDKKVLRTYRCSDKKARQNQVKEKD